MPGIEDLTNIMVTGGRDDIPLGPGAAPMAPTAPQQLAGGPPMGDPAAMESLMANADMLQGDMQRPPMEGGGGIEQDAMALADAVVGRAQGDINAALAILEGAAQIVMGSGQQEQPLMAAHGRAISDRDRDLFTETGRTLSDKDIMYANAQAGKTLSDKDREFTKERLQKIIDYENY